ncbi:MAG: PIN domain-containing protein [Acidimicrobiales bacterium]
MALTGWIVDNSVAQRLGTTAVADKLAALPGRLCYCPIGELERLYSARSAKDYERLRRALAEGLTRVDAPPDVLDRALTLQRDLAHHHGLWHRIPIPDLVIAETAIHHELGVAHVDGDYERIAQVRQQLATRRLA